MVKVKDALKQNVYFHMVILFGIMLLLNFLTPRMVDDLSQRSAGAFDFRTLFSWLKNRYLTWSGRMVADANNGLFLGLPKYVFNIINAALYVLLMDLMCRHAIGARKISDKKRVLLFIIVQILAFFNFPAFGQVILWESGAANYLWNIVIIFAFLLPYRLYADSVDEPRNTETVVYFKKHKKLYLYLSFFGIIAGWTNENTAGGLILMEAVFLLSLIIRRKKIPVFLWSGLASTLVGFGCMIAAPGNYARRDVWTGLNANSSLHKLENDITGTISIYRDYPGLRYVLVIFIVLVLLMNFLKHRRDMRIAACYAVTCLLIIVAYWATGDAPTFYRGVFGASVFFIIATMILIVDLLEIKKAIIPSVIITLVFFAFMILQACYAGVGLIDLSHQEHVRQIYTKEQIVKGNTNVTLPAIERRFETTWSPMNGLEDVTADPTYWTNTGYCNYFHADTAVTTDRVKWQHLYLNGDPVLMNLVSKQNYLTDASKQKGITLVIVFGDNPSQEVIDFLNSKGIADLSSIGAVIVNGDQVTQISKENIDLGYSFLIGQTSVNAVYNGAFTFTVSNYTWSDALTGNNVVLALNPNGMISDYVALNSSSDRVIR